jgi:DNA-binding transcriptional regulator YdaS (Cro superfamily)
MTPKELSEAGKELYGDWGWQTRLAEALGVDGSTVRRWISGAVPIPNPAAAAVNCFLERKRSA